MGHYNLTGFLGISSTTVTITRRGCIMKKRDSWLFMLNNLLRMGTNEFLTFHNIILLNFRTERQNYADKSTHFSPTPLHEFIDPVFAKTRPKRSFSVIDNERFGLLVAKTGSINSATS